MDAETTTAPLAPVTCAGTTKAGTRCRAVMNLRDGLCLHHHPDRAHEAEALHRAGGLAAGESRRGQRPAPPADWSVPPRPRRLRDVPGYASWLTDALVRGHIDARTGCEAAKALREFRQAAEKVDLQREVQALRKELRDMKAAKAGRTT